MICSDQQALTGDPQYPGADSKQPLLDLLQFRPARRDPKRGRHVCCGKEQSGIHAQWAQQMNFELVQGDWLLAVPQKSADGVEKKSPNSAQALERLWRNLRSRA
ncbi:hypothetical protein GCM10008955_13680 [Deinococcus malanensis]|uniref:Uncharacterized protein n=1 Tax=Deinococcus malanensis TaxID=1706855 RepID=A0ABQ2EQY9_9DEIO|nr:hypothetical protein GCM10008955_13680 [Deinococcus malanensis]